MTVATPKVRGGVPPLSQLQPDEREFRDKVRKFAETKVKPLVVEMDSTGILPQPLIDDLFAEGLMNIEIPTDFGGSGESFFKTILAIEELARVDPAVSVFIHVHNILCVAPILRWGTPEQKQSYLPALATRLVGAYALSEIEAGSDAFAMSSRARLEGDTYLVTGKKRYTTSAREAGLFLLFANADPDKGARGIASFLIERSSPGFSVGQPEDKMGIRASSTCELTLENVPVPVSNLLGKVGMGYEIGSDALNKGRIGIGAQMVGLAQGAFELALAYAQERKQFGQPIATFQGVHFPLAEMAVEIEAARLMVYNAARMKDAGVPYFKLITPAAMAKYFASQVAEKVASQAVEIFGGFGFTKKCPVEKLYRDAKIGKIYEGTSNIQLRTIASNLIEKLQ